MSAKRFLLSFLFFIPWLATAQPLLTPAQLQARLADPDLRVVDIRGGRESNGKSPYENGHIPGAQSAPYPVWRGPKENPGALLPAAQLTQVIQGLGIDRETPVVVVVEGSDHTDFGAAARVVWTLKAGGVKQVSILNGGMKAWRAASLPLTAEVVDALPTPFELKFDPRLLATREEVVAIIAAPANTRLLDARPAEFFAGEDKHGAAKSPGTLAGAKNVDNAVWFKGDTAEMLPVDEIRRLARDNGVDTRQPTVSFCNSGHWAATNWFVLSEVLGQPEVKLYPESMVGWSQAGLPMANVPSRLRQFYLQLRAALAN
ncbi:MAG: rhodanese-like domain-containing protein [Burkholderiaceae bacterium]